MQTILDEYQSIGEHKVQLSAESLMSGIYLLNIRAGDQFIVKKLIVTK